MALRRKDRWFLYILLLVLVRRTTQPPILPCLPIYITPNRSIGPEHMLRIILVLDLQQGRVVGPEVVLLPVRVVPRGLVHVRAAPGRGVAEQLLPRVELGLVGAEGVPTGVRGQRARKRERDEHVPPRRQHRVAGQPGATPAPREVGRHRHDLGAAGPHVAQRRHQTWQRPALLLHRGARDHPAADRYVAGVRLAGPGIVVLGVVVADSLRAAGHNRDIALRGLIKERCQGRLDAICCRSVR